MISNNDTTLYFHPASKKTDDRLKLFNKVAYAEILEESIGNSDYSNIKTDFDIDIDRKVIAIVNAVENMNVELADNDYFVKVVLKDDSIYAYAYAPRRFALAERIQVREITDDLLTRGIIKPSVSPYCARVVPVRRKMEQSVFALNYVL